MAVRRSTTGGSTIWAFIPADAPDGDYVSPPRRTEHLSGRPDEDLEIPPQRPVLDVEVVEARAVRDGGVAPQAVDLRPAGQPRGHPVARGVPRVLARELVDEIGALR